MDKLLSLHRYFKHCNGFLFVFLMFALSIIVTIILSPLFNLFDTPIVQEPAFDASQNLFYQLFKYVIFIPLFETFIFQFLVIEFLYLIWIGKRKVIFFSALLFAAIHYYSIGYMLYAFSMGVILSYSYVIQKSTAKAFLIVYAIHLLRNALAFLLQVFGF
jgi:membrane protease YdiL (CAAX protease family)